MFDPYSCKEIKKLLSSGGQLVDVRSTVEYCKGALSGAVCMPAESMQHHINTLDSTKPVLIYCHSGQRSAMAKQFLELMGFENVHNIGSYQNYVAC